METPNPPFVLLPTPLGTSDFPWLGSSRALVGSSMHISSLGQAYGVFELLMLDPSTIPLGINKSPEIRVLESIHPAPSSVLCPLSSTQLQHGPSAGICPHGLSQSHCQPSCCQVCLVSPTLIFPPLPSQSSSGGTQQCDPVGVCMDLPLSPPLAVPAWWHLKPGAQNCLAVAPAAGGSCVPPCTARGCVCSGSLGGPAIARLWQGG